MGECDATAAGSDWLVAGIRLVHIRQSNQMKLKTSSQPIVTGDHDIRWYPLQY